MDLLKLAAKIELDDSSYKKGIADAEKAGKTLAGKIGAMTVAVGNIAADMIKKSVSAINQVIGGAIDSYADYQQLIGGVETLFKGSARKVAEYAQQSFKTTGLSANDYMETVTSFSASLLQGLGGDTAQAADMANMAITDMADNANKMGTDISAIQNAYQGFAKQNYTMLDNLKLGYGGTASEMVRLINDSKILDHEIKNLDGITFDQIVQALHVVQTEMGITGTTAKEAADTISGSKASLKAAWEDLLSAIGGEGDQGRLDQTLENFKTSFSTYMKNFIPTLTETIVNSGSLVDAIADSISDLPTDLMSKLGSGALESGTQIVSGLSKVSTWIIESIANMFKAASADPTQIAELGAAIGDFIGTAISDIAKNAPAIVTGIFDAGVALAGGLVEGLFSGLFGEGAEVDKIKKELTEGITDVDIQTTKASAILNYMDSLVEKYGDAQKAMDSEEWKTAASHLEEVLGGSGEVFDEYGSDVQGAIDKLKEMTDQMRRTAIQSGLTKALSQEYELLGEQQARQSKATTTAEEYGYQRQALMDNMIETIRGYAREYAKGSEEREFVDEVALANAQSILDNGKAIVGNDTFDIRNATAEQLSSLVSYFAQYVENGEESVWNKDMADKIFSPEEISKMMGEINTLTTGITEAMTEAKNAQTEIDATLAEIAITEKSLLKATDDAFSSATTNVTTGGADVEAALEAVSEKISGIQFPTFFSFFQPKKKAIGLDYVPYNGYVAELHEGEAILTKRQNQERRNGMSAQEMATVMEDALVTAMEKVTVYMSGQKVGDLTTRRVKSNINSESSSRQRAMGG